jgi:hypothetical protein
MIFYNRLFTLALCCGLTLSPAFAHANVFKHPESPVSKGISLSECACSLGLNNNNATSPEILKIRKRIFSFNDTERPRGDRANIATPIFAYTPPSAETETGEMTSVDDESMSPDEDVSCNDENTRSYHTSGEVWNIYTGYNSANLADNLSFETVAVDLDTRTISSDSADLVIISDDGGSYLVMVDGKTIITAFEDDYGVIGTHGANKPEGVLDNDRNTLAIHGGTFVATGGANSTPIESASTQNTVSLGNANPCLLIDKDDFGNRAISYKIPETVAAPHFGSPEFDTRVSNTIYQDGEIGSYSELFNGLYLDPTTHSNGSEVNNFKTTSTVTLLGASDTFRQQPQKRGSMS